MRILTIAINILLFASCAQIAQRAKVAINKDKYEKELSYKEGDLVEFTIPHGEIFTPSTIWNGKIDKTGSIKKNLSTGHKTITRFGLKGSSSQKVSNISAPKDWYLSPSVSKIAKVSFTAKVIKVDRECEPYVNSSGLPSGSCRNGDQFIDELAFVKWSSQTQKDFLNNISAWKVEKARLDQERKAEQMRNQKFVNSMNPVIQRKKNPKQAKICDQELNKVSTIPSDIGKNVLGEKEIIRLARRHKNSFDKLGACTSSFLLTEKQSEKLILISKCLKYASTGLRNNFCR